METKDSDVWLVTGANSGFGLCLVRFLLEQGVRVVAAARRSNSLDILPDQDRLLKIFFDLRQSEVFTPAVNQIIELWGRIDVLVNNAGYGLTGAFEELTEEQMRDQMETNFMGLVLLTQKVIPHMRNRGKGYIVNIASIAGLRGFKGMSLYCASKFAVVGFSESLAQELAPFGIAVSIVEPGPYRTDWAGRSLVKSQAMLTKQTISSYTDLNESLEQMMEKANGRQPGDPMHLAQIIWHASKQSNPPLHMVLGDEAIQYWQAKLKRFQNPTFMVGYPHGQIEGEAISFQ